MKYTDKIFIPSYIIEILKENRLYLKSRMGQNFMTNRDLALRILDYSHLKSEDVILEVGSGLGTLTFLIAERARWVFAVEIDGGFLRYLKKKNDELGFLNISIINRDILSLNLDEVTKPFVPEKVISNFPYNVGIKAIMRIIEQFESVKRIVGTVQSDLAERLSSKPGFKQYSFVSVYLQYLSDIEILERNILPQNFFPTPEVSSSVIDIKRRKGELPVGRDFFKRVVRSSFSNRRKNLSNNLSALELNIGKEELKELIFDLFYNEKIRAEELSVEDFVKLSQTLLSYKNS